MTRTFRTSALITASCAALALVGCKKAGDTGNSAVPGNMASAATDTGALPALPGAVPMQAGPATPIAAAPPASALPPARPVALGRPTDPGSAYAYLDRAYGVADTLGDAPPDYTYDDDGVSPWVWQTRSGDAQYAEPVDGGYRYYYYQPGADQPYLVRDPSYSYAYAGGALVAIYAASGALLPSNDYGGRHDDASRYFWRGRALRDAAMDREHRGVVAADWATRRADINAARANWAADRAQQAEWNAYHSDHQAEEQAHWADERQQRQLAAQRFAGWQQGGFRGRQGDVGETTPRPPAIQRQEVVAEDARRRDATMTQQRDAQARAQQAQQQQAIQREQQADRQQHDRAQAQARQQAEQRAAVAHEQGAQRADARQQAEMQQAARNTERARAEQDHDREAQARLSQAREQAERSQAEQQQRAQAAQRHDAQAAEQHAAERQQTEAHAAEAREQSQAHAMEAHQQAEQRQQAQAQAHAEQAHQRAETRPAQVQHQDGQHDHRDEGGHDRRD